MYTPYDGDVIATSRNDHRMVKVVVKTHGYYSTVLGLYDKESYENEFSINVGKGEGKLHADLGRLSYSRNSDLEDAELIRTLDTAEYDRLLKQVGKALGIPAACASKTAEEELDNLKAENSRLLDKLDSMEKEHTMEKAAGDEQAENLQAENAAMCKQLEELQKEVFSLQEQAEDSRIIAAKKEAERDIFEKLYKELLERTLGDR